MHTRKAVRKAELWGWPSRRQTLGKSRSSSANPAFWEATNHLEGCFTVTAVTEVMLSHFKKLCFSDKFNPKKGLQFCWLTKARVEKSSHCMTMRSNWELGIPPGMLFIDSALAPYWWIQLKCSSQSRFCPYQLQPPGILAATKQHTIPGNSGPVAAPSAHRVPIPRPFSLLSASVRAGGRESYLPHLLSNWLKI